VKGISARAVGVGSVRIIVEADDGEEIHAMEENVLHVPELSCRASRSYQGIFRLTQAQRQGHCVVLLDPVDHLRLHAGHGGGVVVPFERAHLFVLLPARDASSNPAASVANAPLEKRLSHSRLGHLGDSQLDMLLLATPVEGVAFSAFEKLGFYETRAMCKLHVRRISREPANRNVGVFEVLRLDFCGPMSVPSLGGRRYNLCAVDYRSRFILHDAVRSKDEARASFRRMLTTIRSLGHTVRRLRVDNGTVFLGAAFRNLLDELNIAVDISAPYAHWQHGRIERQWGTLVPMAQSMIRQAALLMTPPINGGGNGRIQRIRRM
jgi:transposase InsO family protein